MMKVIVYQRDDGGVSVVTPAQWARLCSQITVAGERVAVMPPASFDVLVRAHGTSDLTPCWAESEDEFIERIRAKDVPQGADSFVIDQAALPDRAFRGAWQLDRGLVRVDMDKAREIHRARLRDRRKPLLEALDVEYQRADESGDLTEKKRIAMRKQALRDALSDERIDAASSPGQLAAILPEALK